MDGKRVNHWKGQGKHFDFFPKDALFVRRVNENDWFRMYQKTLVQIANTDEGRDLLCIPKDFPRVDEIAKNYIKHYEPRFNWRGRITHWDVLADFRVGAKWANVIRYRWPEFCELAERFIELPFQHVIGRTEFARSLANATLTAYPDPHPESTTVDGMVYRTTTAESWATIKAGAGTDAAPSDAQISFFAIWSGVVNFDYLFRSIYLFNTSSLTSGAVISSATCSFSGYLKENNNGNAVKGNVFSSSPASNTDLVNADYGTLGTTQLATGIAYASLNDAGYSDFTLNASGIAAISLTGVTKFGGREQDFDAGSGTAVAGVSVADRFNVYSADQTGTTSDPKLVVTYTLPATGVFPIGGTGIIPW